MALPLVLAGPIVRRVDPRTVAVWIAFSQARRVSLQVFRGPVIVGGGSLPAVEASGAADTLSLGANLHIVVVTATPPAPATLTPGTEFAYNLSFAPPGGGAAADLQSEGLLADGTLANGLPHLALGYGVNALPGFRTPPAAVSDLRLAHGSCRKPHDLGVDALVELDNRLRPGTPPQQAPLDAPPHLLLLTGDQIYADDVALCLLPTINRLGLELTGAAPETLPLAAGGVQASLANLPAGLRQDLVQTEGKLTSTAASCHLLSFAEFAAMYLMVYSNAVWPATLPPPTDVNAARGDGQPAPVRDAIPTDPDKLVQQNCERRAQYCRQLTAVLELRDGLPRARRALANVATYMMMDDHEITDDWYINLAWKRDVLESGLGRTMVRNGLTAYGFFQGWGNDPVAFESGSNAGVLAQAAGAISSRDATALTTLDQRLGLVAPFDSQVNWHFHLLDDSWRFGVLGLDTRTRRGFRSPLSPPALIAPLAMATQIPPTEVAAAGREVLFVLAPAPVLGVPVIEELLQPLVARFTDLRNASTPLGTAAVDVETWSGDPGAFEQLLALLAPARRVVFLSGDVHFAHGSSLSYWVGSAATPVRFGQFTSSALKNSGGDHERDLLRSLGFGQRVFRSGAGTARLGWTASDPPPLTFPPGAPLASFPIEVRTRFRQSPVLLPAARWPAGVAEARPADFAWRLDLLRDSRPESQRPPEDRPTLPPDLAAPGPVLLTKIPEVARYHSEAMSTRALARQQVFSHNLGLVSIEVDAGRLTAQHAILSPPLTDPAVLRPITLHRVALDPDPAEPRPQLQA